MCTRRWEESRKKPVHNYDRPPARQLIPKMKPGHIKGTIARMFFGSRDLKCNGHIRTETVFSFVDTKLILIMKTINKEN